MLCSIDTHTRVLHKYMTENVCGQRQIVRRCAGLRLKTTILSLGLTTTTQPSLRLCTQCSRDSTIQLSTSKIELGQSIQSAMNNRRSWESVNECILEDKREASLIVSSPGTGTNFLMNHKLGYYSSKGKTSRVYLVPATCNRCRVSS